MALVLQVRHQAIQVYNRCSSRREKNPYQINQKLANLKQSTTYSGVVTYHTQQRIKKAVNLLLQISPKEWKFNAATGKYIHHQLSFITLTIPHEGNTVHAGEGYNRLLKPFIRVMHRLGYMQHYLWKYEFQQRGQGHWHITTNDVIPYQKLKIIWNDICKKEGLYNLGDNRSKEWEANSTDIHAVQKLDDIEAYLVKYLAKDEQNEQSTKGKVWGCSQSLKQKSLYTTELNTRNCQHLHYLEQTKRVSVYRTEYTTTYRQHTYKKGQASRFIYTDIRKIMDKQQQEGYRQYLSQVKSGQSASPGCGCSQEGLAASASTSPRPLAAISKLGKAASGLGLHKSGEASLSSVSGSVLQTELFSPNECRIAPPRLNRLDAK